MRGLYHEHVHQIVDEKCFGEWIREDMSHVDDVMTRLFTFQFPIAYEDALKAATELVNLFYMNQRYCSTYKIWEDLNSACPGNDILNCFSDFNVILNNAKNNIIPIFTRCENMVQILLQADLETDEEILNAVDKLGEDYGALISYIMGFNKRFENGDSHKHSLKSSKSHGLLKKLF